MKINDIIICKRSGNIGLIKKPYNKRPHFDSWLIDFEDEKIYVAKEDMDSEFEVLDNLEESATK